MDRRISISVILLILIFAQGSDAWLLSKKNLRRMLVTKPIVNTTNISPSPAPIPEIKPDFSNVTTVKDQKLPVNDNSSRVDAKTKPNDAHVDKLDNEVAEGKKKVNDTHVEQVDKKVKQEEVIDEQCDSSAVSRCAKNKTIACLKHSREGSQDLLIVIQNEGESALNVSIRVPPSIEIMTKELKILEHHVRKINVSTIVKENLKIVLNTSDGECVLYTGAPISEGNFFQKIPTYANQVTPMHGAYFMFAVTLIVGVSWASCKLVKKGRRGDGGGVPYQELEMALPQSVSAVNGDEEDGWDDNWDDDWDDGGAIKSPGPLVGNPSANGLTSRAPNRDGWENDWDD